MLLFFAVRWGPDKPSDNNVENGLARSELPLTMGMSANTAAPPQAGARPPYKSGIPAGQSPAGICKGAYFRPRRFAPTFNL